MKQGKNKFCYGKEYCYDLSPLFIKEFPKRWFLGDVNNCHWYNSLFLVLLNKYLCLWIRYAPVFLVFRFFILKHSNILLLVRYSSWHFMKIKWMFLYVLSLEIIPQFLSIWGEWPSGLRHFNQHQNVPVSNPIRHSAGLKDPTLKTQWLTLGQWGFLLVNGPKLAMGSHVKSTWRCYKRVSLKIY